MPRSLPAAWAILFPATRFPTMTDAGPTPTTRERKSERNGAKEEKKEKKKEEEGKQLNLMKEILLNIYHRIISKNTNGAK